MFNLDGILTVVSVAVIAISIVAIYYFVFRILARLNIWNDEGGKVQSDQEAQAESDERLKKILDGKYSPTSENKPIK